MTKEVIELIEKNVLSQKSIPDKLIELFEGEDWGRKRRDYVSARWKNNGTIKTAQDYFLSLDYRRMTEDEIDSHLLGYANWLKVCSNWKTAKEFAKRFIELEGVPEAWKAYVLTISVSRGRICSRSCDVWKAFESPAGERGLNYEEQYEWYEMIKDKSGAEAQIFLDMSGAKWTAYVFGRCLSNDRYKIIDWLLRKRKADMEKLLSPLGMATEFCISGREFDYQWDAFPEIELENFLPLARLLGEMYPGIYRQLFKLLLTLR